MTRFRGFLVLVFVWAALSGGSSRAEPVRHTFAQARVLVFDAAEFLERAGPERAFDAFNNPISKWVRGDLYIFAFDMNGVYRASGFQPERTGINAWEMTDPKGFKVVQEFIRLAKAEGSGLVEYLWHNPVTGRIETKTSFIMKVGEYVIGAGFYIPGQSRPDQ